MCDTGCSSVIVNDKLVPVRFRLGPKLSVLFKIKSSHGEVILLQLRLSLKMCLSDLLLA